MSGLNKNFRGKVVAVASGHAGYNKKMAVLNYFEEAGIPYKDLGCYSNKSCDYPDFAHKIAEAIGKKEFECGITFCGSGQGINITANKHQNIRSALCWNTEISKLAREHNDSNICAIPSRFVSEEETIAIVESFLNAEFERGRHARRVKKIPLCKKDSV
ncbi:RpiB/LacA/LacB family sugar-phosphate isomerase [Prolixibacter sp. SD074]|uniref:RpiB/LacA/LacB family sugar-phosphate isomerase n=1 Tax=Prolixibacter sp. SD074 TaxID=2652391 RepID=UPI001275CA18|nr:RpiB/LacA/LacB family sugar-phosphate isomerase [Prolixibacter sp. SD074]GET28867.1 ribose 5-phosphate isomerase B [Prolixibacter sp. SD074]